MTIYEINQQAMLQKNPLLASELFSISENKEFEVFQGKDPIDINFLDIRNKRVLYNHPINDVTSLVDLKHSYERYPYRYFFGIANGVYLKTSLQTPLIERILVVEPNIELIYIVLNLIDFSQEIIDGKLIIESVRNLNFTKANNYLQKSKLFARLFELEITSDYYLSVYQEEYSSVISTLTSALSHSITGHGNSAIDALEGIHNHFENLPSMVKGPIIHELFGKEKGETAIIVATGPSLTKQLPLLKKIQKHVKIISLDASLPILEKHGIKPDYVTVIERIALTAKFFERTSPEFQKDVNFICVSIIHKDVKNAIKNGNLYFQMRPHGYTHYFGLNKFGYIGVGMSTANLAHELAVVLGFKNVILIGQDLAFGDDDSSHADNHTFNTTEIDPKNHNLFTTRYGGEGQIRTTQVWTMFRNHFEATIEQTKHFFTTVNATEGGSRIEGSIEMSFQEAVDKYVDLSKSKKQIQPQYLTEDELNSANKIIIDKTNYILQKAVEIQEELEDLFLKVQAVSEELVILSKNNELDKIDFNQVQELSDEIDIIKRYTKEDFFNKMFFDTVQSYLVQQELDLAEVFVQAVTTEEERQTKLVDWVMKHRYWLFSLAGGIDAQRDTMIKAIQEWPDDLKSKIVIPNKKEIEYDQEEYLRLKSIAEKEQQKQEAQAQKTNEEAFQQLSPKS